MVNGNDLVGKPFTWNLQVVAPVTEGKIPSIGFNHHLVNAFPEATDGQHFVGIELPFLKHLLAMQPDAP